MRVGSPQGRFASEAALLDGRILHNASAWGKHLFLDFGAQHIVHVHLGLIGSFRLEPYDSDSPWGQVRLHLHRAIDEAQQSDRCVSQVKDGALQVDDAHFRQDDDPPMDEDDKWLGDYPLDTDSRVHNGNSLGGAEAPQSSDGGSDREVEYPVAANLRGPQWCRLITGAEMETEIGKLGADPLRPADPLNLQLKEDMFRRLGRSRRTISSLLMDQKFFAGVGNIYRAEVLFRLGINPETRGSVASDRKEEIWEDLVRLMAYGEQHGRIDTVREQHQPEAMGRAPREDDHGGEVYVYRRAGQPCLVCGHEVKHAVVEGRNLFWCPTCQK